MPVTVKARKKPGANSLDLTIPAAVCRDLDIKVGDVFEVTTRVVDDMIEILYTKVYKYRKNN